MRVGHTDYYDDIERRTFAAAVDAEVRLKALEREGMVGEVLFPDAIARNEVPFRGGMGLSDRAGWSLEVQLAGQRAYNRWLADFCDPVRQVGLPLMNYGDIEHSAREIEWAASVGMKGVMLDGVFADLPPLFDDYYEPIWSRLEETGIVACFHGAAGAVPVYDRNTPAGRALLVTEGLFFGHRILWFLIWGGVLERHPGLKCSFTEQNVDWLPRTLTYLDWMHDRNRASATVPRRPSEYWARQCAAGASTMSVIETEMRHDIGVDTLMWGSDSAHPEGTWLVTLEYLRATFGEVGVSEDEARAMLGLNAARFYGLDADALQTVANDVGPTVEEILDPNSGPEPSEAALTKASRPVYPG
jgi:predicted TIM-barrel fold metal-dependent hydrolase